MSDSEVGVDKAQDLATLLEEVEQPRRRRTYLIPVAAIAATACSAAALWWRLSPSKPLGAVSTAVENDGVQSKVLGYDLGVCPMADQAGAWGVVLDGRSANGGRCAYGCPYADEMQAHLNAMYQMLNNRELPVDSLTIEHFKKIREMLGANWRKYNNPISNEVHYCHSTAMHPDQVQQIMADVTSVNAQYEPRAPVNNIEVVTGLLNTYNNGVATATSVDDLMVNLARLLRNLAFIHPLANRNSRSRLLILQYELRRLNIACGASLFNYGKNIYFETLDTTVMRFREGIQVYQEGRQTNFQVNPWTQQATIDRHFSWVPMRDTDTALMGCWRKYCPPQPNAQLAAVERAQLEQHGLGRTQRRLFDDGYPQWGPPAVPSGFCKGTSPL